MTWKRLQIPIILVLLIYLTIAVLMPRSDGELALVPAPTRTAQPTFPSLTASSPESIARVVLPTNTVPPTDTSLPSPTWTPSAVANTRTPRPSSTKTPVASSTFTAPATLAPKPSPTLTPPTSPSPEPTRTATSTSIPSPAPAATLRAQAIVHRVAKGESLTSIALEYGTTVDVLVRANSLGNPDALQIGQELTIPPLHSPGATADTSLSDSSPPPAPSATPTPRSVIHTVKKGETLLGIAALYNSTAQDIMEANALASADLILVGQVLLIPPSSLPSAAPTATP